MTACFRRADVVVDNATKTSHGDPDFDVAVISLCSNPQCVRMPRKALHPDARDVNSWSMMGAKLGAEVLADTDKT